MLVPRRIREIYLATSLLMLLPAFYAAEAGNVAFAAALVVTCAASLANWSYFVHESAMHCADRVCSAATLACACWQEPRWLLGLPFLALLFFCGRRLYFLGRPYAAARWHLVFRYFAFWLCYVHAGEGDNTPTVPVWAILTAGYAICVKDAFVHDKRGTQD